MDYSIWILIGLLVAFLLVVHLSHPITRRFLFEGFVAIDYTKPSVDLSQDPDFMAFYEFHTEVCELWNKVITEVMKNTCGDASLCKDPKVDCGDKWMAGCPPKAQYIATLKMNYNLDRKMASKLPACFIECDTEWDANSTLSVLSKVVPANIKCYRGALEFILDESNKIIAQVKDAFSQIPAIGGFADYTTTITCNPDANGINSCQDENGTIYVEQTPKQQEVQQQVVQNMSEVQQQEAATNQIIAKCKVINAEIPEVKELLAQAIERVAYLLKLQMYAKDGTLINKRTEMGL